MSRKIVKKTRDFKGVWIPKEIWLAEDLDFSEIVLLTEIDSLSDKNGCFASNAYFAEFIGKSPQWVSRLIQRLKDKGYIKIRYEMNGKEIKKRIITPINYCDKGYQQKFGRGINYCDKGYQQKFKDNNTTNNTNIINTNSNNKMSSCGAPYKEIIDYLNEQTNKKFRYKSKATQRLIHARLQEGYTKDDFKKVIDNKVADWKGSEWEKYLQPQTLFRASNFEGYLNESVKTSKPQEPEREWLF